MRKVDYRLFEMMMKSTTNTSGYDVGITFGYKCTFGVLHVDIYIMKDLSPFAQVPYYLV